MSIGSSLPFNFIAEEVRKLPTENPWSAEASKKLAKDIEAKVDPLKINIRIVQKGDNLGRIAEGLSREAIKLAKEGGAGWEGVQVEYLGESDQVTAQKKENPSKTLDTASLVYSDQYVLLWDNTHLVVADTLKKIQDYISTMMGYMPD